MDDGSSNKLQSITWLFWWSLIGPILSPLEARDIYKQKTTLMSQWASIHPLRCPQKFHCTFGPYNISLSSPYTSCQINSGLCNISPGPLWLIFCYIFYNNIKYISYLFILQRSSWILKRINVKPILPWETNLLQVVV